jgi:D-alanine transaminase
VREGLVYLQVTRGVAERDFSIPIERSADHVFVCSLGFAGKRSECDRGATAYRSPTFVGLDTRYKEYRAVVGADSAKQAARCGQRVRNADAERRVVTEGGSSNIWIVKDGVMITRQYHVIFSPITRDVTRTFAHEFTFRSNECPFTIDRSNRGRQVLR